MPVFSSLIVRQLWHNTIIEVQSIYMPLCAQAAGYPREQNANSWGGARLGVTLAAVFPREQNANSWVGWRQRSNLRDLPHGVQLLGNLGPASYELEVEHIKV